MGLKEDRRRTAKATIRNKYRGEADRKNVDFSGYDTKNRVYAKTRKVRKGPRGGKYVMVNRKRRYI